MRRLFNLVLQLIGAAIAVFVLTAAWIVFDGLKAAGDKADVALVAGYTDDAHGVSAPMAQAALDRVVHLYKQGEFSAVIVSGSRGVGIDEEGAMKQYLEKHGIPADAIIEDRHGNTTQETARDVARIMEARHDFSVMLVTDYFRVTRLKLMLNHDGVQDVRKAPVGQFRKEDAWEIGREVVALYAYIEKVYFMPTAEKVKDEAKVGAEKAKVEAEKAKTTVDQKLNSMEK